MSEGVEVMKKLWTNPIYAMEDNRLPKVRPLAEAIMRIAIEQGATYTDFKMAVDRVIGEYDHLSRLVRLDELSGAE